MFREHVYSTPDRLSRAAVLRLVEREMLTAITERTALHDPAALHTAGMLASSHSLQALVIESWQG